MLSSIPRQVDIEAVGHEIFERMARHSEPHWDSRHFYAALMAYAMRDPALKTQLFRFVDLFPTLKTNADIVRYLREYLAPEFVQLPFPLRAVLDLSGFFTPLSGLATRIGVSGMARQFIAGENENKIMPVLKRLHRKKMGFTVDLLGEAVVSELEADLYAERVQRLLERIIGFAEELYEDSSEPQRTDADRDPARANYWPIANLSLKISALSTPVHPADPDSAIASIKARLRPILRRALKANAFVNIDMEHYAIKDLTLRLYREMLEEDEFEHLRCGICLQAYLRDTKRDLSELAQWARRAGRRVTVRLVKGANWDCEIVLARQQHWPEPVFTRKAQSDVNFERLTRYLFDNADVFTVALGSHNVRSIAHAIAYAQQKGIPPRSYELQALYGMADPLKRALVSMGHRVRVYCPVGELIPGMAYLVRRLLENTSNEGFLRAHSAEKIPAQILLQDPLAHLESTQDHAVV